jgi:hypothetical protein
MKRKLTLILTVFPTAAFAAENGPIELVIGIGGMIILSIIVLAFANKADNSAEDPTNMEFAGLDTLYSKLISQLDLQGAYNLHIVRQSGNVERTIEELDVNEVVSQISSTMKRAKIDLVSIRGDANHLELYRVMHNGRGRQEGKRIGGFDIQKVGELNSSTIQDFGETSYIDSQEIEPVKVTLKADNEARQALVIAFFKVVKYIDTPPKGILDNFDPDTGKGRASLEVHDMIQFLVIADKYLTGTGELTADTRQQLVKSDAAWQREVGNNTSLNKVMGIISFEDASPQEIQEEFKTTWEWSELLLNLHGDTRMVAGYKDVQLSFMEDFRPKILDEIF